MAALKPVIGRRTQPDQLVFLTKYGNPWSTDSKASAISSEIRKIREAIAKAGHPFNDQLGFYDLRRAFATFGASAEDKQAVSFIMGHATADMTEVYEQGMLDSRLIRCPVLCVIGSSEPASRANTSLGNYRINAFPHLPSLNQDGVERELIALFSASLSP